MIGDLKKKIGHFFLKTEGGKRVLNRKNAFLFGGLVFALGLVGALFPVFRGEEDSSELKRSDAPLLGDKNAKPVATAQNAFPAIGGVTDHAPRDMPVRSRGRSQIKYKAKQVIGPGDGSDRIPRGSNFIGKLLSSIDTRSPQSVQVVLPYGGSHKSGSGSLPKETILFGSVSYPGQGEKVYINFDRGVLPDGQEVAIQARALSSKDYTTGILGDFHSNTVNRMASVMGLSMVSGVSEVMVEKEALGQTYVPTPKATLKNGFYNGLSKVTQNEANIQAEKLAAVPEYVTVESGTDLIISLTASFGQGER